MASHLQFRNTSQQWRFRLSQVVLTTFFASLYRMPATLAFSTFPTTLKTHPTRPSSQHHTSPNFSSRLHALIFDESGSYENSVDDSYSSNFNSNDEDDRSSLISRLMDTSSAELARIAAAFAPPGHEIHPNDLTSAQVVNVGNDHIEISAVLCETEECVTLFVPVDFPRYCAMTVDKERESCVMENIQELDETALQRIQQQEYKDYNKEELAEDEAKWVSLQSTGSHDQMPPWWISAQEYYDVYYHSNAHQNNRMIDECQNIKNLLNDVEFRDDLMTLATRTCTELYPLDTFQLTHAAVADVGPAGMIVKANVHLGGDQLVVDLPVPFSSRVDDVEDLRDSVLGIVEAA